MVRGFSPPKFSHFSSRSSSAATVFKQLITIVLVTHGALEQYFWTSLNVVISIIRTDFTSIDFALHYRKRSKHFFHAVQFINRLFIIILNIVYNTCHIITNKLCYAQEQWLDTCGINCIVMTILLRLTRPDGFSC
jgi:hypothetical protein